MKGFSEEWCALINGFVSGGSVVIKVNDNIGKLLSDEKGLQQGDPLSPMLFNIVADMTAIMIERVKPNGQLKEWFPILSMLDYLFFNTLMMQFYLWNMTSKKQEN
jgi:hypothetical protein